MVKDKDYDEIDERLDQELFEAIFGTSELPKGTTHKQAIGQALAAALDEDMWKEVEEFIEVPELDELIKRAENRIYGFTLEEWNSMSDEEQIRIQDRHEYDLQHEDQAEWLID